MLGMAESNTAAALVRRRTASSARSRNIISYI
jgi:hypothetical protein